MFGYIYKTTNIINGKIYIGMHKANFFDTKYMGSGIFIKQAFKKYGKNNFVCELIDIAENIQELKEKEIYYINLFNSRNLEIGYNIHRGGYGGSDKGRKPETIAKMSASLKGRKSWNEGKHLSKETKEKIAKSRLGKKGISGTKGKKMSVESKLKMYIDQKGIKHTEEYKKMMSKKMKGRVFTKEHCENISKAKKGKQSKLKGRKLK